MKLQQERLQPRTLMKCKRKYVLYKLIKPEGHKSDKIHLQVKVIAYKIRDITYNIEFLYTAI